MISPLIVKEFKDLIRDPRIWIPFIISALIMPIMGLVIAFPMKSAIEESLSGLKVGIVNLDKGREAVGLINFLGGSGVKVIDLTPYFSNTSNNNLIINDLVKLVKERKVNVDAVMIFPRAFTSRLAMKSKVPLVLFCLVREVSIFGSPKVYRITSLVEEYLRSRMLKGSSLNPNVIMNPVNLTSITYLEGKGILLRGDPQVVLSSLGFSAFFLPLILMIISVSVIQMAATSTAVENEERTLETLLTFPLSKFDVLLSKLLGSFGVSLIGSVLNLIGFVAYLYIFSIAIPSQTGFSVNLTSLLISGKDLAYLIVSLLATLFFMAALGVIVGALSSDVRIAGSIVGPLAMAVFIPGYFISFANLSSLSPALRALMYSLPLTQPIALAKKAVTESLPLHTPIYLMISLAFSVAIVALTARIFSLETLSSLQRRLSRLRRRR